MQLFRRLVFLLCLSAASLGQFSAAAPPSEPNVLWLYVDDMSDWMGCYGHAGKGTVPTPHIDSLAENGIRFEHAFMPAPVCSSTRSALITGTMQTSHGLHHHRTPLKKPLPDGIETLPELFRAAGYITFNEAKDDYNFDKPREDMYSPEFERPGYKSHLNNLNLDWLEQLKGKKFFGQIQLRGGKFEGETGSKYPMPSRVAESDVTVPPYYPDDPVIRNMLARHYEQVAATDEQVGAILAALKAYGLWENTVVFFFTDHGGPMPRAKQFLYEDGTKVPLIVHWPVGREQLERGGRVRSDLVSGIDISASTLGLAKLPLPDFIESQDLFAVDFKPRTHVISARDRCGLAIDRIRAVRTDGFRYLRNSQTDRSLYAQQYRDNYASFTRMRELLDAGKLSPLQASYFDPTQRPSEELYDLKSDPHQVNNLAADPAFQTQLLHHRHLLRVWETKTNDKGRYAEDRASLRATYQQYRKKNPSAPEFDFIKAEAK